MLSKDPFSSTQPNDVRMLPTGLNQSGTQSDGRHGHLMHPYYKLHTNKSCSLVSLYSFGLVYVITYQHTNLDVRIHNILWRPDSLNVWRIKSYCLLFLCSVYLLIFRACAVWEREMTHSKENNKTDYSWLFSDKNKQKSQISHIFNGACSINENNWGCK